MISNRSTFSNSRLALAVLLVLVAPSCLLSQSPEHSLAVKAEGEADLAHAPAGAQRVQASEPEYFEGEVAPQAPAAMAEERPNAPSSAHVWIAGQHTRRDGAWVWVSGRYAVPPSADVVWVPGHWVSHLHGYAWIAGAWR